MDSTSDLASHGGAPELGTPPPGGPRGAVAPSLGDVAIEEAPAAR